MSQPWAALMTFCMSASDAKIVARFLPSATFISACMIPGTNGFLQTSKSNAKRPSDSKIDARFFRSASTITCIASSILGGIFMFSERANAPIYTDEYTPKSMVTYFVPQALDAPRLGRLVEKLWNQRVADILQNGGGWKKNRLTDDAFVERLALPEDGVERNLAHFGAHGRLRELHNRILRVFDAVGSLKWTQKQRVSRSASLLCMGRGSSGTRRRLFVEQRCLNLIFTLYKISSKTAILIYNHHQQLWHFAEGFQWPFPSNFVHTR